MCMCDKCRTSNGRGCGTINARKTRSVPFVPSATAAGSEKFTNSLRKPKNTKGTSERISLQPNKNRPKMNGKTEYDEKFVEWELPEHATKSKQHAPTSFYDTDMETFNWQSEQKRSFVKKNAYQGEDERGIAGVARAPAEDIPASFAWPGGDRAEPPEEPRTKKHAMKGQMSEHKNKYQWPEMEERVKSARPTATIQASPIALDTNALIDSAQQWHSEYDAQCAELRRKQQDLLKSTQAIAGVASNAHGTIPAFYAWEEPEAPRGDRPQPTMTSTRGATSEYKNRFVEWGHQERQQPVVPVEATHLNLFKEDHPTQRGQGGPDRTSSVLRHDYPGHDVTALGSRAPAHPDRGDANPKSFAWPLVDGNLPEEEDEQTTRMRKHRQKNLVNGANCSEYTRTFANPPADAYNNPAQAHKPTAGKALDLFADKARGQVSEYKAQYHAFPGSSTPERRRAHPRTDGDRPTQFAWSLVNGGDATLESPVREKRPPKAGDDVSEYNRKFNWPVGERSPVRRGAAPGEDSHDGTHLAGADSIMGLDAADLNSSKWQSEYDLQCARLRQKQQELRGPEHIAGVATKDNGKIPRNYAWEMPPVPVPDPSLVVHHFDAAQHSEYGSSFQQWPQQAKRESFKPTVVSESLNLFREKDQKDVNADDIDAMNSRLQSEYNEKFHAFEANNARQKSAGGLKGVPLPSQFAWPRVDPPAPPSDKPKGDLHVAFNEVSEYGSSFAWPSSIEPAKIVRPTTPSGTAITSASLIFPVGDSSAPDEQSQWVSEYDAHTKDVLGSVEAPTAGMPSFPHAQIPNFYAWIDKNGQAKREPQPERPRYSANQVRSEHDAAFAPPAAVPAKVSPVVPKVTTDSLNLMALPPGSKYVPGVTEYDSKYIGHSAEAVKQLENPYANKKSSAIEVPKPAQFAWPLVDGEPKTENEPPRETANTAHSEYSTQFTWHGLADTVNGRRATRVSASVADEATALAETARAVVENGPIAVDETALRASDWQSEYDDRSSALQRKQKELALKETLHVPEPRTAGLVTAPHDDCPAFYAWEPKVPQEAPQRRNTGDTGTTEYRSSFQTWPVKAGRPSAAVDKTAHTKPIEAFRVGRGTHFEGVTEYDDQFIDKTARAKAPPAPNSLTASMNARYSAANLIAPPPAPAQRVPSSFIGNTSKISKHTENRDNYSWPQSGRLSARKATPVLNSQRSKVVIGVNHPAVRDQLKSSSKTTSRVDYTAPDSFPESDFQSQATSESGSTCPDKENCNRVCNVCEAPITNYKKSEKYKLMARELKERPSPPRSAYTTGVLSSPASTVQSARAGNTYNSTMSVDSLGAPAADRFSSSFHTSHQRLPASESHQVYRAHSVPHRQRLAVTYNHEPAAHCPIKNRQSADDSNPVLMNKRYPYVSKKQLGRWSTETGDQFRWRNKASSALGSP